MPSRRPPSPRAQSHRAPPRVSVQSAWTSRCSCRDVDLLHQRQYPRRCADVHAIAPGRVAPLACARVPDSKSVGIRCDPHATPLARRQLHASPARQPLRRLAGRRRELEIQLRDFDALCACRCSRGRKSTERSRIHREVRIGEGRVGEAEAEFVGRRLCFARRTSGSPRRGLRPARRRACAPADRVSSGPPAAPADADAAGPLRRAGS